MVCLGFLQGGGGETEFGVVLLVSQHPFRQCCTVKAKTAGLGATPSPNIWTLPGSVHQMRLHNERFA